ncbi:MAG TPA: excinuclease ABC subunit UvrA [Terriglobales bacterium]|jgi:excinuclease ABC subunit A|nr:excinuclease ABC subunit UvrA [Terriglobales bacterium]
MAITRISVRGARQHNLKNIDVEIPRNTLTVITGLSGSGKSSLAFDTIYAEGQRRYVETLSAYARQFLDQMERPDVDSIDGLSPSISIEQKTTSRSPRSTVGTITEIYDYLRLLYSSIGVPHCPNCGKPITRQSAEQIVQRVMALTPDDRVMIMAPIVRGRKGEFKKEMEKLIQHGFSRARVDGELVNLEDDLALDKRKNHTIEVVIDRLLVKPGIETRLEQSVALAMKLGGGLVLVAVVNGDETLYSSRLACPDCGISVPQLEPRSFSFNSSYGACPECHGLGSRYDLDAAKVIVDWSKPILDGGLGPGSASQNLVRSIQLLVQAYGFNLATPFEKFPDKIQNLLLNGEPQRGGKTGFLGILGHLKQNLESSTSDTYREYLLDFMSATECSVCHGKRLRPESLAVKVNGMSIADFTSLPIARALDAARKIKLTGRELTIAGRIAHEITERLQFLHDVGLGYLSLGRSAATLSGGEGQRIRLATQIGSKLRGVLYVLDEPSIGLHHRDNGRLLAALENLRDLGNTVLVVEHDEETIRRADYVIDLGPGAGRHGGELVASGTPAEIMASTASLTGAYIAGRQQIAMLPQRRSPNGKAVTVFGARENNLKNFDVVFPLGVMTVVTGVSGSGKSTLVNDILYRALAKQLYRSREEAGSHKAITGAELVDKVIRIDQSPIGRTPRSNPATYTGIFAAVRDLYAMLPESRERGYKPGRFSFNVAGGRCEACQGEGQRRIEMNFLPDVYVQCEVCGGRRYNHETLSVHYNGHSIADLLEMPVSDVLQILENIPQVKQKLQTLVDVGLGYIHLGQSAVTLSGGEAQRIKLARELSKRQTGKTLYLLDEPTTGLHFDDVRKLLDVLHRLTDLGNTVIIIEHNLDVIRNADWILDLGPEGGEEGGRIVAQGTPEQVARVKKSYTGQALTAYFNGSSKHSSSKNGSARNEPARNSSATVLAPTGTGERA